MRIRPATVVEHHANAGGSMDNMAVRQHQPVRTDDETRSAATLFTSAGTSGFAYLDLHDRRTHHLGNAHHCLRIGVQQSQIDAGWRLDLGTPAI